MLDSFSLASHKEGEHDTKGTNLFRRDLLLLCWTFGVNHATVTTPLMFSSSVLTNSTGQGANALLFGACLVSSLFLSNLVSGIVGHKIGLVLSMLGYAVYVLSFANAAALCIEREKGGACKEAGPLQMPLVLTGAFIGGCGAGVLWTCQGALVTHICEKIAATDGKEIDAVTGSVMGIFGSIFLGIECVIRASTTVLLEYCQLSFAATFYIWSLIAFLSVGIYMIFATDFKDTATAKQTSLREKLLAAVSLWQDPILWCLQCTSITFGFAQAWISGYVSRNILSKALGTEFVGYAGALVSGLAAVLSKGFDFASQKVGKILVVALGALAFLALGVCSKWVGPEDPKDWGNGAVIFYIFMGIGRAVFETTNKAIISDFFIAERSAAAFANINVFNSLSGTVAFVLGANALVLSELYLLIAFAVLTLPGVLLAYGLRKHRMNHRNVLLVIGA